MATYFSKNPLDWYALEGIYIAEMDQPGGASIRSNAGLAKIVAELPWGPTGELVKLTAGPEFRDTFIGQASAPQDYKGFRSIAGKLWGELHIVRPVTAGQAKASVTLQDGVPNDAYEIDAKHVGAAGDEISYKHVDNQDGTFDLTVTWGNQSTTYQSLALSTTDLDDGIDDDFVNVTLIDDAAGVPADATGLLAGGSDGAPTDVDYEDALDVLLADEDGGVVFAAEHTSAAWLTAIAAHATEKRAIGVAQADTSADFATNIASAEGISNDRMVLAVHRVKQFIESQLTTVDLAPFVASVLVNSSPHISPAAYRNRQWLRPIRAFGDGVQLTRADYIDAKQAGAVALEQKDGNWSIVSGVTSDITPGKEQINTRRMKDLIANNSARVLAPFQSEPPYESNVNGGKAALVKMLDLLAGDASNPDSQMIEAYKVDVVEVTGNTVQYQTTVELWGAMDHIISSIVVGENVKVEEA